MIELFHSPAAHTIGHAGMACRTVNWGEFRSKRFQGDYADVGEEVQIEYYHVHAPPATLLSSEP